MKNNKLKIIIGAAVLTGIIGALTLMAEGGKVMVAGASEDITAKGEKTLADEGKEGSKDSTQETAGERIYCVGSVSKVYVTAAAMKLVDEGKIALNDPVTEYIPDFKMADERYKDITVRMLMDHTSGIMGTSQIGSFMYENTDTYHHDNLLGTLSKQRLKAAPGAYAAYCNDGFDLLEQVVENVSGMSYTDYAAKEIAAPTGGKTTGSAATFADDKDLAPAFAPSNLQYDNESCMCIGAGGIYSTASDVAGFGTAFFDKNGSLLTEASKEKMRRRWDGGADDFGDASALGWDYVSLERYEDNGVSVLGKGGDVLFNHAFLMVAPKEEISISVLSNGGSSMYNGMLAEAIMDTVLDDRGISVKASGKDYEAAPGVPAEYDTLAGYYAVNNALEGGNVICRVSFPDHKYMHVENISPVSTSSTDYIYTTGGQFAELAYEVEDIKKDTKIAVNPTVLTFVKEDNGSVYIAMEERSTAPGLGDYDRKSYIGEKMSPSHTSEDALKSWALVSGKDMLLCNDLAASANYQYAAIRTCMCDEIPGYLFMITGQGTRLLKITDADHACAFQTIPSSSNRDLVDLSIKRDGDDIRFVLSSGNEYIPAESIPKFEGDTGKVTHSGDVAAWYSIGDDLAGSSVSISDMADDMEVYVYNKYGDVVYTTHIKDSGNELPMPKGGRVVFLN